MVDIRKGGGTTVTLPGSSTDNALVRWDGTGGATFQNSSGATLSDNFALTLAGAAITASEPILNLTQTWNNGAVTFTGLKLNVTATASAAGSLLLDLQVGGASVFYVKKNGDVHTVSALEIASNSAGGGIYFGASSDLFLGRDAANTLALRNGATAQTLRAYNTFTDASNGEWFAVDWATSANVATVGPAKNGTGTVRAVTAVGAWTFSNAAGIVAIQFTSSATDFLHVTTGTLANGAAASVGTLTNAPAAGNPTKWIAINDNGTTRYIPAW